MHWKYFSSLAMVWGCCLAAETSKNDARFGAELAELMQLASEEPKLSDFVAAFTQEVLAESSEPAEVIERLRKIGLSTAPKLMDETSPMGDVAVQAKDDTCLPFVQMHGMGDFGKNPAYKTLGKAVSKTLTGSSDGCYFLTPQLGESVIADIIGGFLRPLDASIDYFAEIVRNDSVIAAAGSFNAIGYSQGNLIIRGYIEKYNDPVVNHHMAMFGPFMGVAGFPDCPLKYTVCQSLANLLGELAYLPSIQAHLMQANYYRDPMHITNYREGDVGLAALNNEQIVDESTSLPSGSLTLAGMTGNLTLVKGLQDITVQPNDSEWYGYFTDGSQTDVVAMQDAEWYSWFGLDKMLENGQLGFETTDGGHMQFSTQNLTDLVAKYWV